MLPTTLDPELVNHFSVAIYPFLHSLTSRNRAGRLEALGESWAPWWDRLNAEQRATALEATGFFLPYVRSLLYPEVSTLLHEPPGPGYAHWAEQVQEWTSRGLTRFARRLPSSAILHLTLRDTAMRPLRRFAIADRPGTERKELDRPELGGCLDWVDALLFPAGVGILLLKYRVDGEQARLSHLIDLNRAVRLVHPPTLNWSLPRLRFEGGASATVRELMNFLMQGLAGPMPAERCPLPGPDSLETAYTDSESGLAYGDRCQLLSFACGNLAGADPIALPAGVFPSGEDRLLFEYAACIQVGHSVHQPMWVPSPEQAERLRRENRLAPWRCWKAMALKESCVFLGTEDISFNRRSLPHVIENDYLPLYLFALYQKVQLMIFANDLMREVAEVDSHLRGARELLRRFVAFRNRFWFNEVTRKPQGSEVYRLMRQSLDVPALYDLALTSVKEAKEYYEDRWDRQVRFVLAVVGLGGPLAAALGAARTYVQGLPLLGLGLGLVAATAVGAWWAYTSKRRRRRPVRRQRKDGREKLPRLLRFPADDPTRRVKAG